MVEDTTSPSEEALAKEVSKRVIQISQYFITNLYTLLKVSRFHSVENSAFFSSLERIQSSFNEMFQMGETVSLLYSGKDFYVNENRIKTTKGHYEMFSSFSVEMEQRQVGKFLFSAQPSNDELAALAVAYNEVQPKNTKQPFDDLVRELSNRNVTTITLSRFTSILWDDMPLIDKRTFIKQTYFRAIAVTRDIYRQARSRQPLGLKAGKRIVQNFVDVVTDENAENTDLLILMTEIKNWQGYLFNHAVNTTILSLCLGNAIGMGREPLRQLGLSALLADIGNAVLPTDVLDKAGELDDNEWVAVKRHPLQAVSLLANFQKMDAAVLRAVASSLAHHRHYDGGGYPDIPVSGHNLFAEIITICDRYDAMTTPRPYRTTPLSAPDAINELAWDSGTQLNPILVKVFINWMGPMPIGTVVALKNGEIGLIVSRSAHLGRHQQAKIRVLCNAHGAPVPARVEEVDLNEVNSNMKDLNVDLKQQKAKALLAAK